MNPEYARRNREVQRFMRQNREVWDSLSEAEKKERAGELRRLREKQRESKRQIIGVYKRSAACDIVQLEHLDNQIDAKVPSYLRF